MEQQVMAAKEVIEQYPKVKQLLLDWELLEIKKLQLKSIEGVEGDIEIPEVPADAVEQMLYMAYAMGPRFLYNFFDDNTLYVCIIRVIGGFSYEINGIKATNYVNTSREETEKVAFIEGFKALENKP